MSPKTATTAPPEIEEINEPLITKYRPASLADIVGHETTVKSIATSLKSKSRPHTFIFVGAAGLGKTTFARIIAAEVGCTIPLEINAGVSGGVDKIRAVVEQSAHYPLSGESKAIIIDECQAMSKEAFDAVLKDTEEPYEHLYWFFLTTDERKLSDAIKTRAHVYKLLPVGVEKLAPFAVAIAQKEGIDLPKEFLMYIAANSGGSPRQVLSNISKCNGVSTLEELVELVSAFSMSADIDPSIADVARLLLANSSNIKEYQDPISKIKKFDGAKKQLKYYFAKVMNGNPNWTRLAIIADSIDKLPDYPDCGFDLYLMLYRIFTDWRLNQ